MTHMMILVLLVMMIISVKDIIGREFSFLYTDFCQADELSVMREYEVSRSYIAIVKDTRGNKYIIKQHKKKDVPKVDVLCVREMFGACMAEMLGIPANKVRLIPAGESVRGKPLRHRAATIHEFIEGNIHYVERTLIKKQGKNKFSLRQLYSRAPTEADYGLTLLVILSMACHRDFPRIVALDTFLGISDRKARNMIYDEKKDIFYFIDFDNGCMRDLCYWAAVRIKEIIKKQGSGLGKKEYVALAVYYETLKQIVDMFPPEKVDRIFQELFEDLHMREHDDAAYYVGLCKKRMRTSYESAKKLLVVLKELFALYSKNTGFYH
ncbi:MAG TPA: hypothetical protein VEK38_04315 [Candidatus Bathyarchaeia archaeon]|nr:hypothetical protein [Candidatus Bathyarchaeia archaeon]